MVSVTDVTISIINTLLVPLISVNTITNVMIGLLCLNRPYDGRSLLELKLRLVFSICGPITDVTIGVLSSWPPFTF